MDIEGPKTLGWLGSLTIYLTLIRIIICPQSQENTLVIDVLTWLRKLLVLINDTFESVNNASLLLHGCIYPGVGEGVHLVARNGDAELLLDVFQLKEILKILNTYLLGIRL